ncbi:MAG: hypothetical protein DI603_03600 [Roseateles depolymerans]|uniref:HTH OST-type domain-containing protein n=1 Tax=Roseateles depolymerans TaxID=76731 RepID=A0A2W5DVJ0_9BURK|nr:MAG: hypothetical protein DI603_03600 [Roseateles depolymerans]
MSTPADRDKRIALLIDADNSPANKIDLILTELAALGVANVRRAYGNWKKDALKGWEKLLHEHAIRPMQQFDYSKGKNASDMAMVIDAMELLYTDRPDAFGIVSSDADFTPLVMHLRAKGAAVYGFGNQQTPAPFVNACSRFLYLDKLDGGAAAHQQRLSPAQLKQDAKLVSLLRHAVQGAANEDGWATVGVVGQQIRNQASFDPRNYGFATLSRLLEATQLFDLKREGNTLWVRDRRDAKPAPRGEAPRHEHRVESRPEPARAERAPRVEPALEAVAERGVEPQAAPAEQAEAAVAAVEAEAPAPKRRAPRKKAAAVPAVAVAAEPVAAESAAVADAEPKPRARRPRAKPAAKAAKAG